MEFMVPEPSLFLGGEKCGGRRGHAQVFSCSCLGRTIIQAGSHMPTYTHCHCQLVLKWKGRKGDVFCHRRQAGHGMGHAVLRRSPPPLMCSSLGRCPIEDG